MPRAARHFRHMAVVTRDRHADHLGFDLFQLAHMAGDIGRRHRVRRCRRCAGLARAGWGAGPRSTTLRRVRRGRWLPRPSRRRSAGNRTHPACRRRTARRREKSCSPAGAHCRASRSPRAVGGFRRKARDRLVLFRREAGDEMPRQRRHIFAAVAQRRHENGKHVQAVIQVFAELAFARQFGKIAVGGGDDAHVHLDRTLGADRIDFAFLQRAQQLDLHVEAQFADFVEEQCAAIGFLELAQMLVGRAGKRALSRGRTGSIRSGSPEWRRN